MAVCKCARYVLGCATI